MKKEQKFAWVLFSIYFAVLIWIVLFKMHFSISSLDHTRSINFIPFAESVITNERIDLDEIIGNMIAFIPMGVFFGMLKPDWAMKIRICMILGISFTIEVLQFILAIGRTDITDIISNTIGGIVGSLIFLYLTKIFKEKTAKILNGLVAVGTILFLCFLMLLLIYN